MRWLLYGFGLFVLTSCDLVLKIYGKNGCQYGSLSQSICHDEVYRNCMIAHRKAGRIKLDENYLIIDAEENKTYLAECIIKEFNCLDDLYYSECAPHVPRHKQSRFSDTGWTPETFFDPEVKEPPALTKEREEKKREFWED